MNYVQYDPETGTLVSWGMMSDETLRIVTAEGRPVVHVTEWPEDFDLRLYDVDLETKVLVRNANTLIPPEPPPLHIPVVISDRQFFQQAALDGYISQEDALKAVQTGFIPSPLQAVIGQISDATEKFNAEMLLSGATMFYRHHPLTDQIGAAFGMSADQIDEFFRVAGAL
jgi:hypothetical protein